MKLAVDADGFDDMIVCALTALRSVRSVRPKAARDMGAHGWLPDGSIVAAYADWALEMRMGSEMCLREIAWRSEVRPGWLDHRVLCIKFPLMGLRFSLVQSGA